MALLLICVVVYLVVMYAVMWPLSVWGHAIGLTPSFHQLRHENHIWEHQHYALVGLRYVGAAGSLVAAMVSSGVLLSRLARMQKPSASVLPPPASTGDRVVDEPDIESAAEVSHVVSRAEWPNRFTQFWIDNYAGDLSAEDLVRMVAEMSWRGWTASEIQRRVQPHCHRDVSVAMAQAGILNPANTPT